MHLYLLLTDSKRGCSGYDGLTIAFFHPSSFKVDRGSKVDDERFVSSGMLVPQCKCLLAHAVERGKDVEQAGRQVYRFTDSPDRMWTPPNTGQR
jgi:hypothetical protein